MSKNSKSKPLKINHTFDLPKPEKPYQAKRQPAIDLASARQQLADHQKTLRKEPKWSK